jgi:hypothetical protein
MVFIVKILLQNLIDKVSIPIFSIEVSKNNKLIKGLIKINKHAVQKM